MAGRSEQVVNARIVYWGVSGAGKTANLEHIHRKLRPDHRGDLQRMATPEDPGVHYEVMPIELGAISGVRTRLQIVSSPGDPDHHATRKQLLDQVDGVVFVIDARRDRLSENLASLEELRTTLGDYGRPIDEVPIVLQYNHRDQTDDLAVEELHRKIALRAAAFEAIAPRGIGVLESLTTISKRVVRNRREAAGLTLPPGSQSQPPGAMTQPPGAAPAPLAPPPSGSVRLDLGATAPRIDHESTLPDEQTQPEADQTLPETEPDLPAEESTLPEAEESTLPETETSLGSLVGDATQPEPDAGPGPSDSVAQAIDAAARRAERLFDENWDQATGGFDERTAPGEALELRLVSAGKAALESDRRLRLPLRVVDQDGREGELVLTLDLGSLPRP